MEFVCTVAAGSLLLAITACVWRPDAVAALTLAPAWCWLLPGGTSTVALWRVGYRKPAGVLIAAWLVFAAGWIEEIRSVTRLVGGTLSELPGPGERRLRVVSLNCATNPRSLADLQRVAPDIVLLQEVPGVEQLERMAQELFGDDAGVLHGGDTAILVRGAIEPRFVDRSAHFVAGRVTLRGGWQFDCLSLRLTPPPARLDFWAPAFWASHAELRNTHRRELQAIVAQLGPLPTEHPIVVGGDFNTVSLDQALDLLRPQLHDAFPAVGRGWGATGTNDWPLFRVDQVWIDDQSRPTRVHAEKTVSSDHRMVVVELVVAE